MKYLFPLVIMLLTFPAFAVEMPRPFSQIAQIDGVTDGLTALANESLLKTRDHNGQPFAHVTQRETDDGVIPLADANRIIDRGVFSAYARLCHADDREQQTYAELMAQERHNPMWSDRQISYIGVLHSVAMGFMQQKLVSLNNTCAKADKANVVAYFKYLDGRK